MRGKLAPNLQIMRLLARLGEHGDPTAANELLGAPTTTVDAWCRAQVTAPTGTARRMDCAPLRLALLAGLLAGSELTSHLIVHPAPWRLPHAAQVKAEKPMYAGSPRSTLRDDRHSHHLLRLHGR